MGPRALVLGVAVACGLAACGSDSGSDVDAAGTHVSDGAGDGAAADAGNAGDATGPDAPAPDSAPSDAPSLPDAAVDAPAVDAAVDAPAVDAAIDAPLPDAAIDAPAPDAAIDAAPDAGGPGLSMLVPATLQIMASGGTGLLTVSLNAPAPAGGVMVQLSSADTSIVLAPAAVPIRAGARQASFRVRAAASGADSTLVTAQLGSDTLSATVEVITAAPTPQLGQLVINEINYDVPTTQPGDANCDGFTNAVTDEFVEIINISNHPLQMAGASLWDATAWTSPPPRFTFTNFVLGPGEPVLVYGGSVGISGASPWCTNLDGMHVGDARAFPGAPLNLDNGGDTLRLTAGSVVSPNLVPPITFPSGMGQSWERSPDITGNFVRHQLAPGHATDRNWTPGTRLDGTPFSSANP
jgi:hypothetical protein